MRFHASTLNFVRLPKSLYGRRMFLRSIFSFFVGQLIFPMAKIVHAKPLPTAQTVETKFDMALRAVVDTLIPDDGITPSGSALGVDKQIISEAQDPRIAALLNDGCAWLDTASETTFFEQDNATRIALLQSAEAQVMSDARTFFIHMRTEAMRLYYTHPEASGGFRDYNETPQPRGYADYTKAPQLSLSK